MLLDRTSTVTPRHQHIIYDQTPLEAPRSVSSGKLKRLSYLAEHPCTIQNTKNGKVYYTGQSWWDIIAWSCF